MLPPKYPKYKIKLSTSLYSSAVWSEDDIMKFEASFRFPVLNLHWQGSNLEGCEWNPCLTSKERYRAILSCDTYGASNFVVKWCSDSVKYILTFRNETPLRFVQFVLILRPPWFHEVLFVFQTSSNTATKLDRFKREISTTLISLGKRKIRNLGKFGKV